MERWPLAVLALLSLCVLCSAEDASKYIDSERAVDLLPFLRVMAHEGFATHAVFNYSARYHPERVMEAMRRSISGFVGFAHEPHDVFAFLLKSEGQGWEELLQQIASVHALAWGHPIAVMISPSTTEDQISHLELLSHVTVHRAMVRHKRLFYLPPGRWLATDQLCALDPDAPPFLSPDAAVATLDLHPLVHAATTAVVAEEAQRRLYGNTLSCILHVRLPPPRPGPLPLPPRTPLSSITSPPLGGAPPLGASPLKGLSSKEVGASLKGERQRICLAISTFNSARVSPEAFSLNTIVLPSLASVLSAASMEAADYYVFLGTQPGDTWDDEAWRERALEVAKAAVQDKAQFRVFRYPLVGRLVDIASKYNMLIMQAHADGCDYIYQFSDDAQFLPSSRDWPLVMLADFRARHDFGVWGLSDTNNPTTMTLGATSRAHIDLQGWFWPPILKNWYSDDYIQNVYGPEFSPHYANKNFHNTQTYGQRYDQCDHRLEMWLSIVISRARALTWAVDALPEWAPYFTNLLRDAIATFLRLYPSARTPTQGSLQISVGGAHAPAGACAEMLALRVVRVPPGYSLLDVVVAATKHAFDSAFSHSDHLHAILDHVALNLHKE